MLAAQSLTQLEQQSDGNASPHQHQLHQPLQREPPERHTKCSRRGTGECKPHSELAGSGGNAQAPVTVRMAWQYEARPGRQGTLLSPVLQVAPWSRLCWHTRTQPLRCSPECQAPANEARIPVCAGCQVGWGEAAGPPGAVRQQALGLGLSLAAAHHPSAAPLPLPRLVHKAQHCHHHHACSRRSREAGRQECASVCWLSESARLLLL